MFKNVLKRNFTKKIIPYKIDPLSSDPSERVKNNLTELQVNYCMKHLWEAGEHNKFISFFLMHGIHYYSTSFIAQKLIREATMARIRFLKINVGSYPYPDRYFTPDEVEDIARKVMKRSTGTPYTHMFLLFYIIYLFWKKFIYKPGDIDPIEYAEDYIAEKLDLPFVEKNEVKVVDHKEITERLDDIKGIDQVREEVMEIIQFMKEPDVYRNAGAKLVKGFLLVGPPGTGKTMLAKALAAESGVNFIYMSASDLESKYVGQSSRKIKKLFNTARMKQPCIIFIDEIDSLLHSGRRKR
jgi:hypothetical protein